MTDRSDTTRFEDLHAFVRQELERRGVRVVLGELADARCLLFSCPDPRLRTLIVDKRFHAYGSDALALYYDILGHVLSAAVDRPLTLIAEREPSAESEETRDSHRTTHDYGRTLFWDCVYAADDMPALVERFERQGLDSSQAVSLCQIFPGSRSRLRYYLKRFGKSRTAAAWDIGLSLLQRMYRKMPSGFTDRVKDSAVAVTAHEMKVALELKHAIREPARAKASYLPS